MAKTVRPQRFCNTQPKVVTPFVVGEGVRYDPSFVGRIQGGEDQMALTGTVREVKEYRRDDTGEPPYQIVTVLWSDGETSKARDINLSRYASP